MFADEQRLCNLVVERSLQRRHGVRIGAQDIRAHFCSEQVLNFFAVLLFLLDYDILYRACPQQIIGVNHERRMSRINDLIVGPQLLSDVPQKVALRPSVQG